MLGLLLQVLLLEVLLLLSVYLPHELSWDVLIDTS